ncbi:TadE/TadG family type IV pilus assembly protein [Neoroseomonas soli]|uniref:Pilus assembly protein n=1 Tax=Neoroseomonas soli TaxID=1081025 RepID=A0A9X9X0S8_9PROT|nr:TadE family protein [Neoroseomonas soli]MBR0673007.1 pilus assembly protein [Neoroseomonas soli]
MHLREMLKRVLRRRDRGVSALEFAIVMPLLMFIMVAIADYGNALQQLVRLETAARAGAQVAFTHPGDTQFNVNDPNATLVKNTVLASLQGWPAAPTCINGAGNGVCVTYAAWCQCPQSGNAAGTSFAYDCSANSPPCEDFERYASVTVTRNYTRLAVVPISTLRGNVEIRVR